MITLLALASSFDSKQFLMWFEDIKSNKEQRNFMKSFLNSIIFIWQKNTPQDNLRIDFNCYKSMYFYYLFYIGYILKF